MNTKVELHSRICTSLNALYERKNHDYGDSFGKSFKEYGMAMPCIRLEDKLNRLKALTRNGNQQVSDESIDDTLMDLANYAIMTLVERRLEDGDDADTGITHTTEHDSGCNKLCQCVTCVHDYNAGDDDSCCTKHGFTFCPVNGCADYKKEAKSDAT